MKATTPEQLDRAGVRLSQHMALLLTTVDDVLV